MEFYNAREDSYFLAEIVQKIVKAKKKKFLDLGTGSGIQSKNLIVLGVNKNNITASDINKSAVKEAEKLGVNTLQSDLFENIKEKFDFILFNAPYLPEDEYDKNKDTCGGRFGDETVLKFLKQVKKHLKKDGKILLLISSLTPKKRIIKEIKKQKLEIKKIYEKKLFLEELYVWVLR